MEGPGGTTQDGPLAGLENEEREIRIFLKNAGQKVEWGRGNDRPATNNAERIRKSPASLVRAKAGCEEWKNVDRKDNNDRTR